MPDKADASTARALQGVRVLAVEDDYLVMLELAMTLRDAGATVRACGTVAQALSSTDEEEFSAAVLDVRVGSDNIAPVAEKLATRGTPFVFYTGQVASDATMARWPEAGIVSKPAPPSVLVKALVNAMSSAPRAGAR